VSQIIKRQFTLSDANPHGYTGQIDFCPDITGDLVACIVRSETSGVRVMYIQSAHLRAILPEDGVAAEDMGRLPIRLAASPAVRGVVVLQCAEPATGYVLLAIEASQEPREFRSTFELVTKPSPTR
jgi:hypothetical protein